MSDESGPATPDTDSFDALLARAARLSPVSAPLATTQLHPGTLLGGGRFRLLRRLGAGGMGVVYEAFDQERGTEVALKTLTRVDASGIYRMKNEFRALADVTHPNLVRLHDLFVDGQLWFFSMELVRGLDLDSWVRPKHHCDLTRLRSGFRQLAHGVRAIHDAGKLHRDLKPSNVLVESTGGRVVILDFGLVTDPEADGYEQTRDTGAFGTPHYMAPEQAAGKPATTASDLYSVGVVLFEALTGRLPFDGRVLGILHRKQHEVAPRAKSLTPSVPDELDALCAALLERDPQLRPSTDAVLRALDRDSSPSWQSTHSATTSPPPEALAPRGLVGRETELARLHECFAAARDGSATLLSICGESGIGKSALAEVFLEELRARGDAVVLAGRCYERENVPYKAFDRVVDELTRYLRQLPEVDAAALLPRDIGALAQVFPVLGRASVVAARPTRPVDDAGEQRRRAFAALAELLARIRDREPLVIYVDDVHWLDPDSTLLFEHLLAQSDPPPMLILVTERESADRFLTARVRDAAKRNARMSTQEISVGPLSAAATQTLAQHLLGDATAVMGWVEESGGNPFFVAELARASRRLQIDGEPPEVSLDRAVRERIANLGDAASALVSVLAVAGRPTPVEVLVQAAGPWDDPHRALDALRSAHLVREAGQRHYDCYHDRIRDAVSGGLSPIVVQRLHQKLARAWSEQSHADHELLFTHWLGAGQGELAGRHAVTAADNAAKSLAFARTAALLARAIELLPQAEIDALGLRQRRADALSLAGRWAEAATAYREAGAYTDDAGRRDELAFFSALHSLGSGRSDTGMLELRALFERSGVRWPRTRFGAFVGGALRLGWVLLRADRARARRERARHVGKLPDARDLMRWLGGAGFVPAYDLPRGLYFMSVFISRALRSGDDAFAGIALAMLSALLMGSRRTKEKARSFALRALELARSHAHEAIGSATLSFVAYAYLLDGKASQTVALGLEAARLASAQGEGPAYPAWAARAAQAYGLLWMGRLRESADLFDANARFARDTGDELAAVVGDCALRHLASGDLEAANALMRRKAQLLDALGARGALRELYDRERIFCLLYEKRGDLAVSQFVEHASWLAMFDPGMPVTFAALQADPRGMNPRTRRLIEHTRKRLHAQGDTTANRAMTLQLTASLAVLDGKPHAAMVALQSAERHYADADMALHAALLRGRIAGLSGDVEAANAAEHSVRELGISNPAAWANMLAPGLELPSVRQLAQVHGQAQ